MTTPRAHADKAALYYSDDRMRCWNKRLGALPGTFSNVWRETLNPVWSDEWEYFVGLQPPLETVTLTMQIPAPMKVRPAPGEDYWAIEATGEPEALDWEGDLYDEKLFLRGIYSTREEAEAADRARIEAMQALGVK